MLATEAYRARLATLGDARMISARAEQLGLDIELRALTNTDQIENDAAGIMQILDVAAPDPVSPGRLNSANASYVLEILRRGAAICAAEADSALVTAPVHKSVINAAGIPFTGHTEFLAEETGAEMPVMMLASGSLRVALTTTHLPLTEVSANIDEERLKRVLVTLDDELRQRFGIRSPRIAVLGLNPHAGEDGVLGSEERDLIEPVVRQLRERSLSLIGPLPADTAFTPEALERCDAILAMYHDQGLPAIKALAFGEVVNITLGLPIVRTSVDHGTALDLAGTGRARPDSLREAIRVGRELALGSTP